MLFEPKKLFFDEILPFFFSASSDNAIGCNMETIQSWCYCYSSKNLLPIYVKMQIVHLRMLLIGSYRIGYNPNILWEKNKLLRFFFSLWKHRTKICFKLSKRDCIEYFNSNLRFLYLGQHEFNKHLMRLVTVSFGKFT